MAPRAARAGTRLGALAPVLVALASVAKNMGVRQKPDRFLVDAAR